MKIFRKDIGIIGFSLISGAVVLAVLAGIYFYEIQSIAPIPSQIIQHQNASSTLDISTSSTSLPSTSLGTSTASWQTYRNDKYGFEFKYPPTWGYPIEKNNTVSFGNPTPDNYEFPLKITIVEHGVKTLDQVIAEERSYAGASGQKLVSTYDIEKEVIDGSDARKFNERREGGFLGSDLYILHWNYIYEILYGNRMFGDPLPETVPQVLKLFTTFKFISPSASVAGTLTGKITIGPICPVESIPPKPECMPTPETYASREFLILSEDQTKTITSFQADASGNYSVSLPAWTYVVVSAKTGIGYMSKNLPSTVTVQAGKTVTLNISVDTGIR